MQPMVHEFKLQDTWISSPSHYLTSGYLLRTPANLNCFWFHLKVRVIRSWLYDGCKFNTTLLKCPLQIYVQLQLSNILLFPFKEHLNFIFNVSKLAEVQNL